MKQYKVGDTIYYKGVVKQISGTLDTGSNYKIPDDLLISNCQIIDELPTAEPVKPVLPKKVADELKSAKKCGLHFVGYMNWALDGDSPMTYSYIFKRGNNNDNIKVMADAWYNGYTVEKPKLYNLILGKDDLDYTIAVTKSTQGGSETLICACTGQSELTQGRWKFTQTEIDELNNNFYIKNIDLNDYKVEVTADIQTKEVEE